MRDVALGALWGALIGLAAGGVFALVTGAFFLLN